MLNFKLLLCTYVKSLDYKILLPIKTYRAYAAELLSYQTSATHKLLGYQIIHSFVE